MTSPKTDSEIEQHAWNRSEASTVAPETAPRSGEERVLLIEDDARQGLRFGWALRAVDMTGSWVRSGRRGLMAVRQARFDILLVGLDLPDGSGLDVVRALRAADHDVRCVILSESVTPSLATDASRAGAWGIADTPLRTADLVAVIKATRSPPRPGSTLAEDRRARERDVHGVPALQAPLLTRHPPGSVTDRWVSFVLGTIDAEADPKTIASWARSVGVSRSGLSECCRLMRATAHDTRDFARLLRALCHSGDKWQPETVLDLADARTLKKLIGRAGLAAHRTMAPATREFLRCQQWIPQDNPGLMALRTTLFGQTEFGNAEFGHPEFGHTD